jgi:hypothetical protein
MPALNRPRIAVTASIIFTHPNLLLRTLDSWRLFYDRFIRRHNGFVTGLGVWLRVL